MEYRKLIKFGNSSSVISIPKSWLERNKVCKGDLLYLEEKGDELSIHPNKKEIVSEDKEITIDVTKKDYDAIQREVVSAYINNFSTIRMIGSDLSKKSEDIREILHGLVALEIMEQSPEKIIAKDFLNIKEASIDGIIRKIDIIIRSMFIDCKEMKGYENLKSMDQDVNRLHFLVLRAVRYANKNPMALKQYGLTQQQLMDGWWVVINLEKIADELKRVSNFIKKANFSKVEGKDVKEIIDDIENAYLSTMKSYYDDNNKLALERAKTKRPLLMKCEDMLEKYKTKPFAGNVAERLKSAIVHIHEIVRLMYSR